MWSLELDLLVDIIVLRPQVRSKICGPGNSSSGYPYSLCINTIDVRSASGKTRSSALIALEVITTFGFILEGCAWTCDWRWADIHLMFILRDAQRSVNFILVSLDQMTLFPDRCNIQRLNFQPNLRSGWYSESDQNICREDAEQVPYSYRVFPFAFFSFLFLPINPPTWFTPTASPDLTSFPTVVRALFVGRLSPSLDDTILLFFAGSPRCLDWGT